MSRITRPSRSVLLVLACVLMVGAIASVGAMGAAAQTTSDATTTEETVNTTNVTLPHSESVNVTNTTAEVWALVDNASANVTATVVGIDADGNETAVGSMNFSASSRTTKTLAINASAYESFRVDFASSDGSTGVTADVAAGTVSESELGGGFLGGNGGTSAVVLVALAAGAFLVLRDEDS